MGCPVCRGVLFDFMRPVGNACPDCHYPFDASWPGRIKSIECPEHMPPYWKFYQRQMQEKAKEARHAA